MEWNKDRLIDEISTIFNNLGLKMKSCYIGTWDCWSVRKEVFYGNNSSGYASSSAIDRTGDW